jgi:hypothetical protein
MKYFLTTAFLIVCLTTFAQSPIDGKWKGTRETPNGVMEFTYTFKVEGKELKGTSKSQFGEIPLENGKVDGKKLSYTINVNGMSINSTGELVNDNEIVIKNDRGEMKLTKLKE